MAKAWRARKWRRAAKEVKSSDPVLQDGQESDIVIPVMGPTGVGKSTFINALLGTAVSTVGHDLESCTAQLQPVITRIPNGPLRDRRLVIVDTPGFDDTYVEDSEILRRIAVWLAMSYSAEMKLAGVIYLHDISQPRMLGTTRKNLQMFRKLCGNDALHVVILGTTKWGETDRKMGEERERQLATKFWKDMVENGSTIRRFQNTHDSAWKMINFLLGTKVQSADLRVEIQHELVDMRKLIPDTEAGKYLRADLERVLEEQTRMTGGAQPEDVQGQEELRKIVQSLHYLKIPISRRILIFFGMA